MAQQISLNSTPFSVGQRQFDVDNLPADSEGFELSLGIGASWRATNPGPLFTVTISIALDGVNFQPWLNFTAQGGDVRTPIGTQLNTFYARGLWPGENNGSGKRRKLRALALHADISVHQAFTAESVLLRSI